MYINVKEIFHTTSPRAPIHEYYKNIQQNLMAVSELEREMSLKQLHDTLLAIKDFCISVSRPKLDVVQRVHPISRKPRVSGYDYISDLKAILREYFVILKSQENIKSKAFYELWAVPLMEDFRSLPRDQFINTITQFIDDFLIEIDSYDYDCETRWNKSVRDSKFDLIKEVSRRYRSQIAAATIIEQRLRGKG